MAKKQPEKPISVENVETEENSGLQLVTEIAVPALKEALADPDLEVRLSAAEALGKIGLEHEAALVSLTEVVSNTGNNTQFRLRAINAVREISAQLSLKCTIQSIGGKKYLVCPGQPPRELP